MPDLLSEIRANKKAKTDDFCEWEYGADEYEIWSASCGLLWYMSNPDSPKENTMNYCPLCGKPIRVKAVVE
jgi:hypothetical protein